MAESSRNTPTHIHLCALQLNFTVTGTEPAMLVVTDYQYPADTVALYSGDGSYVVAYGTCIDGTTCGTGSTRTACGATVGSVFRTADEAWASPLFSTATWVVQPGSYSVLVRVNNFLGCRQTDCFTAGVLQAKLVRGRLPVGVPLMGAARGD